MSARERLGSLPRVMNYVHRTRRGEFVAAAILWFALATLPSVVVAFRTNPSQPAREVAVAIATRTFGREAAAYVGYGPLPLVVHAAASTLLAPLVLLLLAVALKPAVPPGRAVALRVTALAMGVWLAARILGGGTVILVMAIKGHTVLQALEWEMRLGLAGFVTSLVPAAVAALIAFLTDRRIVALVAGCGALLLIAFAGTAERLTSPLCSGWSPAELDRCLHSGRADLFAGSVLRALALLLLCLAFAFFAERRLRSPA